MQRPGRCLSCAFLGTIFLFLVGCSLGLSEYLLVRKFSVSPQRSQILRIAVCDLNLKIMELLVGNPTLYIHRFLSLPSEPLLSSHVGY